MSADNDRPGRERNATIVDVAEKAGVAIGTVSRHLNGQPIREANRKRIEEAIVELDYRRNFAAVAMKTDVTRVVGFLVPALSDFHGYLLELLMAELRQHGRAVLSFCHRLDPETLRMGLDFFASHRVDAIVMDGYEVVREEVERFTRDIDFVLYDNDLPGIPADRVFVDNKGGSAAAVEKLLQAGHRRIATIHGNLRDSAAVGRLEGYYDAFQAHGVTAPADLVVEGGWDGERSRKAVHHLLAMDNPPTAIFTANQPMTFGALEALSEAGLSLPDDMSLVGFDDATALRIHGPGITTVRQPMEDLAAALAKTLIARLENPGPRIEHTPIPCTLIERGSIAQIQSLVEGPN